MLWLRICVGNSVSFLVGGVFFLCYSILSKETPDPMLNAAIYMICNGNTGGLTVYLQQVPNEDLRLVIFTMQAKFLAFVAVCFVCFLLSSSFLPSFPDNPNPIGEDALIAYAWRKFLDGGAKVGFWTV